MDDVPVALILRSQTPATNLAARLKSKVLDDWAPHIDASTWNRYRVVGKHLIPGPISALNIGTGGGIETLRLLRIGNRVTTIEINHEAAARTRARAQRAGYGEMHRGLVGHIARVELDEQFDEIMMCEVLEHILDDRTAIARLGRWLKPGGRLILSTPTARHGLLVGGHISAVEDGSHVRPGYDGPELDAMLAAVGIYTEKRVFNTNAIVALHSRAGNLFRANLATRALSLGGSMIARLTYRMMDVVPLAWTDQITIAVKR